MIFEKDIEIKHPRIDLFDNIFYSHVQCPVKGTEKDLRMMVMHESVIGGPGKKPEKKPAILWIMGGAWLGCPPEKALPLMVYFAERGYTIVSAEYRVSSEALWPAQIQDVMTAIRYMRAHADELGVDESKIAVMGLSAGGHLTAMAGMNPTEYGTEEYAEFSSEVQAAVDMFGPTDISCIKVDAYKPEGMPPMKGPMFEGPSPEELMLGGPLDQVADLVKDATPMTHISDKAAPMLILHGTKDMAVAISQSYKLHDALNAAGHPTDMYVLNGAGHGGPEFFQEEVQEIIIKFLDPIMKG